jgi:hypothetical protein
MNVKVLGASLGPMHSFRDDQAGIGVNNFVSLHVTTGVDHHL